MQQRHPGLNDLKVLIRGGGEMASGVAHRLFQSHLKVALTERPDPLAVRRAVSFCEAVWEGVCEVEGVRAQRVETASEIAAAIETGVIPVLVDPELHCLEVWRPDVLVDATLAGLNLGTGRGMAEWVIGLGPAFAAGVDADVVVETNRGHNLGRLIFQGSADPKTGIPGAILGHTVERVLRAPRDGVFEPESEIGDLVEANQVVARVGGDQVRARISGVLRGLLRAGSHARRDLKVGDVDPRGKREYCDTISDKARALGGSVLEAILARFNR
jgi:xanthine dehydrogenase accessory factor